MNRILAAIGPLATAALAGLLWAGTAQAGTVPDRNIPGISGTAFSLVAKEGYISTPDGNSIYTWGYADGGGVMQYPGPTLIVPEGQCITVNLTNTLPVPVSIVFPGQEAPPPGEVCEVIPPSGSPGVLTNEAAAGGGTVTYKFFAGSPGTFQYHSGTNSYRQVEMGLLGALLVQPSDLSRTAYGLGTGSAYDHENMFLLTGMDLNVHEAVEAAVWAGGDVAGALALIDTGEYHPVYWFINGRSLPDDLFPDGAPWLPNQPYGSLTTANPGQRILIRFIGGTKDGHPIHTHGNNAFVIARDGALLESTPGAADLSFSLNTFTPLPGATMDAIFTWTGKGMGWDFYGTPVEGPEFAHDCVDLVDNETLAAVPDGFADAGVATNWAWEPCAEHYVAIAGPVRYTKRLPVYLPALQDLAIGGFWSGSPYLGRAGAVPPGEGGLNPWNGYTFPWHSHHEKEVVTNDVFPGGNFSVFVVVPPEAPAGSGL